MVIANGNHQTIPNNIPHSMNNGNNSIRNAFSHNPLNILERYFHFLRKNFVQKIIVLSRNQTRPPSRGNGVLKSVSFIFYFQINLVQFDI
jgi:hypothetical protein